VHAPDLLKRHWSHIGHKSWRSSKRRTPEEKALATELKEVRQAARATAKLVKAKEKEKKQQDRLVLNQEKQAVAQFCIDWLKQDPIQNSWQSNEPSGGQHGIGLNL